jgi:hypothetical protein
MDNFAAAREDGLAATTLQPDWSKGHVRLAQALEKLSCFEAALAAALAALQLEPSSSFIKSLATRLQFSHFVSVLKREVETPEQFLGVFAALRDSARYRLATLATLWNESTTEQRHHIFQFLHAAATDAAQTLPVGLQVAAAPPSEAAGSSSTSSQPSSSAACGGPEVAPSPTLGALAHISPSDIPVDAMVSLPMHNYDDITVPQHWLDWYAGLGVGLREEVFCSAWRTCTPYEHDLIVADMQHFFQATQLAAPVL